MLGSRLFAVSEDRSAAMLVGIRPEPMQALAWALAGATPAVPPPKRPPPKS